MLTKMRQVIVNDYYLVMRKRLQQIYIYKYPLEALTFLVHYKTFTGATRKYRVPYRPAHKTYDLKDMSTVDELIIKTFFFYFCPHILKALLIKKNLRNGGHSLITENYIVRMIHLY